MCSHVPTGIQSRWRRAARGGRGGRARRVHGGWPAGRGLVRARQWPSSDPGGGEHAGGLRRQAARLLQQMPGRDTTADLPANCKPAVQAAWLSPPPAGRAAGEGAVGTPPRQQQPARIEMSPFAPCPIAPAAPSILLDRPAMPPREPRAGRTAGPRDGSDPEAAVTQRAAEPAAVPGSSREPCLTADVGRQCQTSAGASSTVGESDSEPDTALDQRLADAHARRRDVERDSRDARCVREPPARLLWHLATNVCSSSDTAACPTQATGGGAAMHLGAALTSL